MNFLGQHILSTKQFDKEGLLQLFEEAKKMEVVISNGGSDLLKGKIMATLFFEPSTRTRFSFETAMLRLGGKVVSNFDMCGSSSIKKKETLFDTGKAVSQMVDVIAMRHPESGSVAKLAEGSDVPVLNGGDGSSEHPTQGLLDVYTMWKEKGGLDGLTVGMVGDLKNSRVLHSQCDLLKHFDIKYVMVSPKGLEMPADIVEDLKKGGSEVTYGNEIAELIDQMDVIGMTRIQNERFESEAEYQKYSGAYVLDADLMSKAKEDAIVMHPLPRVVEIAKDVDEDPRARYFDQVANGVAIRMALLAKVLL